MGFALVLLIGKRLPRKGSGLAVAAVGASFVLAAGTAYQWIKRVEDLGAGEGAMGLFHSIGQSLLPRAEEGHAAVEPVVTSWTWWQSGGVKFGIGTHIDGLAVALLLVVTIISLLVHIFSTEYMRGDIRYTHYFAFLNLFTAGMLTLVIADNTLLLLLGWEIMGLCSFALIGHWWEEQQNSDAALKAFFTTRVGDVGLLVGISILFFGPGTFNIFETNRWALEPTSSHTVLLWASVALFIAVIGKSGQFPLHTWLPDAMAGPTPVSALIHAATMVVAGVYLAARLYPVFWEGFSIDAGGLNMMALIGGITIIIAAVLAFVQSDIKKVLAYSTVSQLGYMVMGLGVGGWTAAVFHIFTHAFFKALLFLGAGSVSHSGSHHSFDMKKDMGGLRKYMPITFWTFIIGTLALMGVFPLAGFWSKDEIIATAGESGYTAFMVVGFVGAFLTAAYMTRCIWLTFFGEYRGGHHEADVGEFGYEPVGEDIDAEVAEVAAGTAHGAVALATGGSHGAPGTHDPHAAHDAHGAHGHDEPHESPLVLTIPLMILAFLAITVGWLNMPWSILRSEKFLEWVEPTVAFPSLEHPAFSNLKAIISVGLVVVAIGFGGVALPEQLRHAPRPDGTQQAGQSGLRVPREQVLPRLPVREHHRLRHQEADRRRLVLVRPEGARRAGQRRGHRRQAGRQLGVQERRPDRRRRRGQRRRLPRRRERQWPAHRPNRQGPAVWCAALRGRRHRRPDPRDRRLGATEKSRWFPSPTTTGRSAWPCSCRSSAWA